MRFIPRIQRFFNIHKSISVIFHINKLKNKNHVIISTDAEKALDKIQHPFMIKTLQKVGKEVTYLNKIKTIYDKPAANIILNDEKLKAFPLRSGTLGCPLSPLSFNSVGSHSHIKQTRKRNKRNPNWKGSSKIVTVADITLYEKNPKDVTKKLLELINEFSKVGGYKINIEKSVAFLYTNNKQKEKLRK